MKFIESDDNVPGFPGIPVIELTERNLRGLLEKLTDPDSARTLVDPDYRVAVRVVQNDDHYKAEGREPGPMLTNGDWK